LRIRKKKIPIGTNVFLEILSVYTGGGEIQVRKMDVYAVVKVLYSFWNECGMNGGGESNE